jgi:iron complex transport system ATP-binding protein
VTALQLRDVRLAYGPREVLQGIDVRVGGSEMVALLGPNGAGKSTLLRCITGVATGRRGAVLIDGVPIEELDRERLARRIAVVPQQVALPFAARVEEVVALGRIPHEHPLWGPRPTDRRAVASAIERVGITHLIGRDARELSLGERQLVLVATALAQSAPLMLLDEPTVHLDLHHQVRTMELLRDLNAQEGLSILAVLHDLTLAAHFFPRLLLLDEGRVVADGTPHEVLTPPRIRGVFQVDASLVRLPDRDGAGAPAQPLTPVVATPSRK